MMRIFDIGRNDECLCGSGKKYKKCCMARVEEVKGVFSKIIEENAVISSYGREFIRVISVMYGIKLSKSNHMFDLGKLARVINEAWKEEENFSQKDVIKLIENIVKMLREKEGLRFIRVPADILVEIGVENKDQIKQIFKIISDTLFIERYLLDIAYVLQNYEFTDEELKNLFHWVDLVIVQEEYEDFVKPLLLASVSEIEDATNEAKEILKNKGIVSKEDSEKMIDIFMRYPNFNAYLAKSIFDEIEDDLEKIIEEEEFDIPFFALYAFYLKVLTKIFDLFVEPESFLSSKFNFMEMFCTEVVEEVLEEPIVLEKVNSAILDNLIKKKGETDNENLKNKLEEIITFFLLPFTKGKIDEIKIIFLKMAIKYFKNLPKQIENTDMVVDEKEILSEEFFNKYILYLESKELREETEYLKKLYKELDAKKEIIVKNPMIIEQTLKAFKKVL